MRTLLLALVISGVATGAAWAQDPTGEWRVANGTAHVRVVDCGQTLWGVVSWEQKPGRDVHNPDPALRQRLTLGMPILLHMRPSDEPGKWEGEVYNGEDGRTYDATIALRNADTLHVEGCALAIFCGGEDWTRLTPEQTAARRRTHGRQTTGEGEPASSAAAICARVAAAPRRTH